MRAFATHGFASIFSDDGVISRLYIWKTAFFALLNGPDMTRRVFEEEAGLVSDRDRTQDPMVDGLPSASSILYETGKAVAAALCAAILLGIVIELAGLR